MMVMSGQMTHGTLTFSNFYVFESHLGARVADQHLSVEREHDVHLRQVNHTTDYVPRLPLATERVVADMPPLSLKESTDQ